MTFWLGKAGSVLTALPHPGKGVDATLVRPARVSQTVGGGQVVARAPGTGRRTYDLAWKSLSPEQHSIVEEFHTGARGAGPFVLLDPWRRNHLTAAQSAATSIDNTTTGWAGSSGDVLASSAALTYRGPRALQWTVLAASAGILTLTPPGTLTAWPTPPLQPWTLSARVRGGGTDAVVTIGAAIVWLDAAGATLSTTLGSTSSTAAGSWSQISASASAPANAVGFRAELRVTPASIAVSTTVTVDVPMLDMASTVRAWVLGTGVPLVSCTDTETSYRKPLKREASLTLVEVG